MMKHEDYVADRCERDPEFAKAYVEQITRNIKYSFDLVQKIVSQPEILDRIPEGATITPWPDMIEDGLRVILISNPVAVTMMSYTGTVIRPDKYDDYWIVRLDFLAIYHNADGSDELLPEIREHKDNLLPYSI